ncbi:MAG: Rpn family recombination-promoting nuclease/putative transposase [Synergistaceae bacterium]|nr:Rpn family recombination-promoting nuclease/putative transposase [Synergistaceae bacterium]MBR2207593.1 Rpn family recombination-promoting nuclease/putative transposase [Synergistaceae bacterium]
MNLREKKWENLTLADDFLFGKVMSEPTLCAEMLRRIFPDLDIGEIKNIETQKTLKHALHIRGVRFDILTTAARNIFDIEAQNHMLKDLFPRSRAYQIVIGYDGLNKNSLKKSGSYENLPNTYVIFICTFDLFGKGRHIYTFRNFCAEDKEIELNDGAYTIFLNTKGKLNDVSPELKNFLNFVGNGNVAESDIFVKTLDEKVKEAKNNITWRNEYMLLLTREDEKFAEGRTEGILEDKQRVAIDMLKENLPLQLISKISQLSENAVRSMAIDLGLTVVS